MHSTMSVAKSQLFSAAAQKIFLSGQKSVDKPVNICLNVTNMEKDFDGKFFFRGVLSESRWLVKTGEDAKADLIPESVVYKG